MDLISVIEEALRDGCGVSLSKALNSERYQQLLDREQRLASRHSRRSHRGLAYRTGHLQMGRLLNTMPEREALAQARGNVDSDDPNTDVRALVWYLGEQLITAAEACLPVEAHEMAKDWKHGNAEDQIGIAKQLYRLLRGEDIDEDSKKEGNWESWSEFVRERWQEMLKHHPSRFLPKQYGKWGQGGNPNCQGKAQMFAAFAKLATARTYTVEPLIDAGMTKDKWRGHVYRMVKDDIANRGIQHVDKSFQESFDVAALRYNFEQHDHSFHVCLSLQLRDGRWVMVDPHALSWGVLSPHYRMDQIDRMLTKYREVLPGLSLIGSDIVTEEKIFQDQLKEAELWLTRSRKMQEVIERADKDTQAITDALAKSGDAVAIAEAFGGMDPNMLEVIKLMGEEGSQFLANLLFWQANDPLEMMGALRRLITEPDFLGKRIDSLLTAYHAIVLNIFRDQVSHAGLLVHPVCEFRNAEYDLALAAINSIRTDSSPAGTRFFLDHQFSQISLSNALHELELFRGFGATVSHERDRSLGVAAARALRALPVRHPICDQKLSIAASLLKENEI